MRNFCLCLLFLLISLNANASRIAIVIAARAVVYQDLKATVPLGYIVRGKQLLVAEKSRIGGTMVPFILFGKLAYIKAEDVEYRTTLPEDVNTGIDQELMASEIRDESKIEQDSITKYNYLNLSYLHMYPSEKSRNAIDDSGFRSYRQRAYSLALEHRYPLSRWSFGGGFDYYQIKSNIVTYSNTSIFATFSYSFARYKFMDFDVFVHPKLSSGFKVKVLNVGTFRGNAYGALYGLQTRLFRPYKWNLVLGGGYHSMAVSGIKQVGFPDNDDETDVNTFNGWIFFLSVSRAL